jgi:predicted TIM-barrel fold metal-dependent hydrolase
MDDVQKGQLGMKDGLRVIDSDLHVIEMGEVYENYLDTKYRDKMPKYLGWSPTNFPHWDVQGRTIPPWARSADVIGPQQYLDAPTEHLYKPVREKQYSAASTLDAMDAEGIDIAVVYRTFAHMVVSIDDLQPEYATAYCAAFNDWLADYCRTDATRLKAAAIVSLHDPELAAAEARRAVEEKGHVGVVLLPMPINGRYFNAPECDVLWQEITRLGVPLAFHGTSGGASDDYVSNRFWGKPNYRTLNHASAFPMELMLALGSMTAGGVLERFPDLRVAFLEGNCGWLPWWLERLDDQWEKYGGGESVQLSASWECPVTSHGKRARTGSRSSRERALQ